jgi:aryl-alcohol dehydrogenase-like predicted oxidoreductase
MIPRTEITPGYDISRIIKGGWHLAGDHGAIDPSQAQRDMASFVEAGITTFDCADIYTGVEQLIGQFRHAYAAHAGRVQIHTKFVPDLSDLERVDRTYVETIIDRSLTRLGVDRIDIVQFHWWDYAVSGYVETAFELDRLRRAGKIARLGVTNFDVRHLGELVDAGIPIATHQLQYSVLDSRPENGMIEYCRTHGIAILCYGTVGGGFLSERWLNKPEPKENFSNRSLIKYKLIIDDIGGWTVFQNILAILNAIAIKHGVDIATVATAAILARDQVAAAIVGATNTAHLPAHANIAMLKLDHQDRLSLEAIARLKTGLGGDIYMLERDRNGPHGQIMKYELNGS